MTLYEILALKSASVISKFESIVDVTSSKTIAESDIGARLICNNALAINITIPNNIAVLPGSAFVVITRNVGSVTFVAGDGVTLESADDALTITDRDIGVIAIKVEENKWMLIGTMV